MKLIVAVIPEETMDGVRIALNTFSPAHIYASEVCDLIHQSKEFYRGLCHTLPGRALRVEALIPNNGEVNNAVNAVVAVCRGRDQLLGNILVLDVADWIPVRGPASPSHERIAA